MLIKYRPRYRIVNKGNFIRSIVLLISLIALLFFIFTPAKKAPVNISYKEYYVKTGDTYWSIAGKLQSEGYRDNFDIRVVVDELIDKSQIRADNLKAGDIIYIPKEWD